jgi:hypothetical protein
VESFQSHSFDLCGGFLVPPWPRCQLTPRQTQHADFPHCAFLFASCEGLWDLLCWERFPPWPLDPVVVEQPEPLVQPLPTPPLPTKAPEFPGTHQVPPHLLFHPVFNKAETATRIANGKVADPAADNGGDKEPVASFSNPSNLLKYEEKPHTCAARTPTAPAGKKCGDHPHFRPASAPECHTFF